MEDHVLEIEYPVALEPKADDMRRLTNDVLEMEYPVVEEHIVEFHEIFEDGEANREENNNDRRLYCKYCGKNFKSHNYVKMHERWHRGELNHHCSECNRAFRYPSELKKHTTIHTGQLPYKCEDCDLRFNKAQAAHEHRRRDHVGMLENAGEDSKSLQPPIVYQMNNNYQPVSFEVVLPNLHTASQRRESKLEHGNDPLAEGFSADSYARPALMPRSSVIRPNYSCRQELNYASRQELNYACSKEPNYLCRQELNYASSKELNYASSKELNYASRQELNYASRQELNYASRQELNYACSKEPNYSCSQELNCASSKELNYASRQELNDASRHELTYDCRMDDVQGTGPARLEEPTVWRESARFEEEMQGGRNYRINAAIEDGGEATDVDQLMENVDDVNENYGSHVHIEKLNTEGCRKCRKIMEYENEIAQLRNHHCAHN